MPCNVTWFLSFSVVYAIIGDLTSGWRCLPRSFPHKVRHFDQTPSLGWREWPWCNGPFRGEQGAYAPILRENISKLKQKLKKNCSIERCLRRIWAPGVGLRSPHQRQILLIKLNSNRKWNSIFEFHFIWNSKRGGVEKPKRCLYTMRTNTCHQKKKPQKCIVTKAFSKK